MPFGLSRRFGLALAVLLTVAVPAWPVRAEPLHDAVIAGDADMVRMLLRAGARADTADIAGLTPLHYAAALGKADAIPLLIGAGADPNARDARGVTPLHLAAASGRTGSVKALLLGGADPNLGFPADGQAVSAARQRISAAVDVYIDLFNGRAREHRPSHRPH
ncbi:MAG: ankyrin repeat domain-containing protein [Alphaproteobacteria bacterium]|nr:ankyrin repeat domain-containing protein [Alphaproteobacteria bacterium]MCB9931384.1 ankyrin repeat domain-containing protein [Alphaproteobacteria bacterium]